MLTLLSHYYIIALCHIIKSYLYIVLIYYINKSYHISLCSLPISVAMTNIHATYTGWLPPHDTTTGMTHKVHAIWQYGVRRTNSLLPLTQIIYENY